MGMLHTSCSSTDTASVNLTTKVKKGEFKIYVTATGELKAKNSEKIRGPQGMRSARIYQTTISDMVPEGTVVKAGDYVARLDKTELDTKLKESQSGLDKIQTQLDQAVIDTAIEMRGLRDQLINMKFAMEEKKLYVEQSKYEPQMVIQQAEIDLQKSLRDFKQLEQKYELSQTKSEAQVKEIMADLNQEKVRRQKFIDLSQNFTITAPKDGMVIYARSWDGKVGPGSQISTWDPVVAELPDLTDMISKTYVNEVDISNVKKGQDVKLKVDAFPDNEYSGQVLSVANIGEQLRGYDAKVFEVMIQLFESDSILRPAMTTSNEILTYTYEDVLSIPLESLFSDSLSFVYKSVGGKVVKQEVITGETNNDAVIIEHGLTGDEEVLLSMPDNADQIALTPLDPKLKADIKAKLEAEKKKRKEEAEKRAAELKNAAPPSGNDGGGGSFIIFN